MKHTAIGIALITALIGTPALAADMPVKAPPSPVAAHYNWTGFYVGGNVGYEWGTASDSMSFSQFGAVGPNIATFGASDPNRFSGVIGGADAGYNWQANNYLLGVETDIQATSQKGTTIFGGTILGTSAGTPIVNPATVTDTSKLDWLGTVRGRIGFTSERWLVYGTGGLAYGEANASGNIQPANPALIGSTQSNAPIVWNRSAMMIGWTIGAGVENAISANWSWKLEYLYVDLGDLHANLSGGLGSNSVGGSQNCYATVASCAFFPSGATGTATSHFIDNILRVGLNYKFN